MIPDRVHIWTARGFRNIGDVAVGDRVISYNPSRGCTEYDSIGSVQTEWKQKGLIGINRVGTNLLLTPDHPMLITNVRTKQLDRIKADDLFMSTFGRGNKLLMNRPFEPYCRQQPIEDVEWLARLAASSSRHKAPPLYYDAIEDGLRDITAQEAQAWLTTFFHWNILKARPNYMKTTLLRSSFVRAMLYHVAPRAGVGTYLGPYRNKPNHKRFVQAFSITKTGDSQIQREHWCADRQDGILYNLTTKNGNFLAKFGSSTFPMACEFS
jgi:hypothetical protein